jgi:hypothetical protein
MIGSDFASSQILRTLGAPLGLEIATQGAFEWQVLNLRVHCCRRRRQTPMAIDCNESQSLRWWRDRPWPL